LRSWPWKRPATGKKSADNFLFETPPKTKVLDVLTFRRIKI